MTHRSPVNRLLSHWKHQYERNISSLRMKLISSPPPTDGAKREVRLFILVRNEAQRLPFMLNYHFNLGVDRAIVLDNGSSDATLSILNAYPHVHVLQTAESYSMHRAWIDVLLRRYGIGHWCLVLDADELFTYPHADRTNLHHLAQFLQSHHWTALQTRLVDMYPKGFTKNNPYTATMDFRKHSPFMDPPQYKTEPLRLQNCETSQQYRFFGGPRSRMFDCAVNCTNYPLVRFSKDMFLHYGRHAVDRARIPMVSGAILHYKYLDDFCSRSLTEAKRKVHWNNASEYQTYAEIIDTQNDIDFWTPESVLYKGPDQLLQLNIMESTKAWDDFVQTQVHTAPSR